jgi:cellulose synthase/poly-beta-1,6-N-acetylglucosamine synthase-like glycosyltransferase
MTPNSPSISVVIPAWNAQETIGFCLEALQSQRGFSGEIEIIVVDDGSTDSTNKVVASFTGVQLVWQEHAGPAAARNLGVKHAAGDIVLFTDADCVPSHDWIVKMVAPFANEMIVGVKGVYLNDQKSIVARFVQKEYEDKYDRMKGEGFIDFIDTYSAGYRREEFLANDGFDSSFPSASVEDQEFSFRLSQLGYVMIFTPEAKVYHLRHAESWKDYFRKKFRIGYWKVLVHRSHPRKIFRDSHTPQILKLQIILVGLGFIITISGIPLLLSGLSVEILLGAFILTGGLFMLTTLPFVVKTWQIDKPVALVSSVFLFLRAISLGLGLTVGILASITSIRQSRLLSTPLHEPKNFRIDNKSFPGQNNKG